MAPSEQENSATFLGFSGFYLCPHYGVFKWGMRYMVNCPLRQGNFSGPLSGASGLSDYPKCVQSGQKNGLEGLFRGGFVGQN